MNPLWIADFNGNKTKSAYFYSDKLSDFKSVVPTFKNLKFYIKIVNVASDSAQLFYFI